MKNILIIIFILISLTTVISAFVITSSPLLINKPKEKIPIYSLLAPINSMPMTYEQNDAITEDKTENTDYIKASGAGSSKNSKKKHSAECYKDSDCDSDYSLNFCYNNNFAEDYYDFSCVKEKCVRNITRTTIEKCGADECRDWTEDYCLNESVYRNRTCYKKGCLADGCFNNSSVETELVKDCENGCDNGRCLINWSNLIIIQMDDSSAWWNIEVSNSLVESFHDANIKLVVEVTPANLNNDAVFLNYVKQWDSYSNIEIAQGFYAEQGFSPPQDNLSYNETRQNLQLGKAEFAQAGIIQPLTYIPAMSYGTTETLDALKDEGFHTEMDYAIAPENRDGINHLPLTIDRGFEITIGEDGELKNESEIKSAVDSMIANKSFANLAFHHQGFGSETPNSEKIDEMISILINLKNQGYNFITAEEYFQYVISS